MSDIDKQVHYASKEKVLHLEEKLHLLEGEIASYKDQGEQLESELDNLLMINDTYQVTIK